MRIRLAALTALTLVTAITLFTGCKSGASNNSANITVENITVPSASPVIKDTQPPITSSPEIGNSGPSPTRAFTTYYEAIKRKDAEAVKGLFSKATLTMMEGEAKQKNTTVDAVIKQGLEEASKDIPDAPLKTRNEKIEGDKATLEVRDEKKDKWEVLHFAREDGQWKLAFNEAQ